MSEFIEDTDKEEMPQVDKHGFTIKPPISDTACILICLNNAPCGTDRKQVARLIQEFEDGLR
jgi:hypothetical protein|tara:strand:+ start:253 stop:438 length:186 start_codon:yes stop_codon:yes gene_type:complete